MKRSSIIACCCLLTCLAICQNEKPNDAPQDVTFCELAKDPAAFVGKRIRVRGIYRYGFELNRLERVTCCAASDPKIWVRFEPDMEGRSLKLYRRKLNKGMGIASVVFIGHFQGVDSSGPLGEKFQVYVDEIEKVERTAHYPASKKRPEWVPHDCQLADAEGCKSKAI